MNEEKEPEAEEEKIDECLEKIDLILRHVDNVRDNCIILGKKLIEEGEIELGRNLIANSLFHDNSKFFGIEWDYLGPKAGRAKLDLAVHQHNTSPLNKHHPEAWGTIQEVPKLFLAEMVADWKSRSAEFGTDLRDWVDEGAAHRFSYKKGDRVYKEIMHFVNLLCDKPFKQK